MTAVPLHWLPRDPPLAAVAAVARGAACAPFREAIAARLRRPDVALRVAANAEWLLVLGPVEQLPWSAAVTYLGWDAGVLVPTTLAPSAPVDLVRRALPVPAEHVAVLLPGASLITRLPSRPPAADFLLTG